MPDVKNVRIWRGNSGTVDNSAGLVASFCTEDGSLLDFTGDSFYFLARNLQGKELAISDAITVDIPTATVTVPITVAQSRTFETNDHVTYELERRNGQTQRTILTGALSIEGGINAD